MRAHTRFASANRRLSKSIHLPSKLSIAETHTLHLRTLLVQQWLPSILRAGPVGSAPEWVLAGTGSVTWQGTPDAILFLFATIIGKVAEDQRRFHSLWGSVLAIVGVGLILTLCYGPLVTTPVLAGILLILMAGLVWWSGSKQSWARTRT